MFRNCLTLFFIVGSIGFTPSVQAQMFTEITSGQIVNLRGHTRSAVWTDRDSDGDLDLFVVNGNTGKVSNSNFLYRNDGGYFFTNIAASLNPTESANSATGLWVDYDNDGDLDLLVAELGRGVLQFENVSDQVMNFIPQSEITEAAFDSRRISPADFDNDGILDLMISERANADNVLLKGTGDGHFSKIVGSPVVTDGGNSTCVEWADVDIDGDLDLFICNATNYNFLYENLGTGLFRKIESTPITKTDWRTGGGTWADFDNDGDMDLYVSNVDNEKNSYYRNDGSWQFTKILAGEIVTFGGETNGSNAIDVDNDGDLDLFVTELNGPNRLYLNDGTGHFQKLDDVVLDDASHQTASAAWGDIDRDGDLDVFISNLTSPSDPDDETGRNQLLINQSNLSSNHWLHFELHGSISNSSGIGSRIEVYDLGIVREVTGGSGSSTAAVETAFGLGSVSVVDSVVVRWPSRSVQRLRRISADQMVHVVEPTDIIKHRAAFIGGFGPSFQFDIEILNATRTMEKVVVFYRSRGDLAYVRGTAEKTFQGSYRMIVESDSPAIEYLIRAYSTDLDLQTGTEENPFEVTTERTEPYIIFAQDVPNDSGGYVLIKWLASSLESDPVAFSHYGIWRAPPPTTAPTDFLTTRSDGGPDEFSSAWAWEWMSDQPALGLPVYSYTSRTLYDRDNFHSANHRFMVITNLIRPNRFILSQSVEAYSLDNSAPERTRIVSNYPNPFSEFTTLWYTLAESAFVTLELFDITGRRIKTLVSSPRQSGQYFIRIGRENLSPGIYFTVLRAGLTTSHRAIAIQ